MAIKRKENSIIVNSDVNVSIVLYIKKDNIWQIVESFFLNVEQTNTKTFIITSDGVYRVRVGGIYYIVPIMTNLIKNTAKEFSKFLCDTCKNYIEDCGCNNVSDAAAYALRFNNLTSKVLYLETNILQGYTSNKVKAYTDFLYTAMQTLSCKSSKLIEQIIKEECLTGISKNTELYKLLMTVRYIGLYFLENSNSINFSDYFGALFSIPKIKDCLCNTCFRYDELEQLFQEAISINTPIDSGDGNGDGNGDGDGDGINLPPHILDNVIVIYSETNIFTHQFTQEYFANLYQDDNTAVPDHITIKAFTNSAIEIRHNNGTIVLPGTDIPFNEIQNYQIYINTLNPLSNFGSIKISVNDGEFDMVDPNESDPTSDAATSAYLIISLQVPNDVNFPPIDDNIDINIYSTNTHFEYGLQTVDFLANYQDNNTNSPVSITFTTLPDFVTLLDPNGVPVTLQDTAAGSSAENIPFSHIGNYTLIVDTNNPSMSFDEFTYTVNDGELDSMVYNIRINLIKEINEPPIVLEHIDRIMDFVTGDTYIYKNDFFNDGSVIDAEDDIIDRIKFVQRTAGMTVYSLIGGEETELNEGDILNMADMSNNQPVLRIDALNVNYVEGGEEVEYIRFEKLYFAFSDVGSGLFSNHSVPSNTMRIALSSENNLTETFSSGLTISKNKEKDLVAIGRIETTIAYEELSANMIAQGGGSDNDPVMLVKANNFLYNNYKDTGKIPNNTEQEGFYDILAFTDFLDNRQITTEIKGKDKTIRVVSVIKVDNTENSDNPTTPNNATLYSLLIPYTDYQQFRNELELNFQETLIDDFGIDNVLSTFEDYKNGKELYFDTLGLRGFMFRTDVDINISIYNKFETDITENFASVFNSQLGLKIYFSKNAYAPSTLYFKLEGNYEGQII